MGFKRSVKPPTSMPMSVEVHKVTAEDAMKYIITIKNKFRNRPDKYYGFIYIMRDFSKGRIDTHTTVDRVRIHFDGYPDLLLGFNKFLPRGIIAI
ncbi:hypothetical protein E2562_018220 [Oryza meyeriana var. granulata]|uniref:Uncharacterized protein n=1 Tax=Oryza meyeriana var. granulata TaxID=110450 RepID=A0A6G1CFB8_9ORYZ|nr:hypothetical protein E2562_018220 [Oryza meyeriana var. granulata]